MFKVYSYDTCPDMNRVSRMGQAEFVFSDLVLAFGMPGKSDEYKVSGEWVFHNSETNECFTIYDWKKTNLYDSDAPSIQQFRANPNPQVFNIGGNHVGFVSDFIALVNAQIEWVNTHKPFEQIVIGETKPISPLFLPYGDDDED